MNSINTFKWRIIKESVKNCRNIIESSDPRKKKITMTQKEKSNFRNLAMNLKTFLSNSQSEERLVSISELANDYLHAPEMTVKKTFFRNDYKVLNKENALSLLDTIDQIADEQFGMLVNMGDNDKTSI